MDVRCERCKTEYEFDDARITEAGVTVKCTTCAHVFKVKKKALVVTVPVKPGESELSAGPQAAGEPVRPREWKVRQASGNLFTFKELTTLQKWIVERKVTRDDEISLTGENWKRLGNIAELASFFQVVEEAQRAQSMHAAPPPPPAPTFNPPPPPPSELDNTARRNAAPRVETPRPPPRPVSGDLDFGSLGPPNLPRAGNEPAFSKEGLKLPPAPPPPDREGGANFGKTLVGLFLLVACAAAGYFGYYNWWLPQEEAREALNRAEAARATREAVEAEARSAEAVPTKTAPPAKTAPKAGGPAPADNPAGGKPAPSMEKPAPAAETTPQPASPEKAAPDRMVAQNAAGASPNKAETSTTPAKAVKAPEPVRDFDWYMERADRLRERDQASAALDAYGQAAELEPERAEPIAGKGLALLDLGNNVAAQASLQQALKLNPRYGVALIGLAELYRSQGKKDLAIEHYEKYLEVNPNGADAPVARNALKKLKEEE